MNNLEDVLSSIDEYVSRSTHQLKDWDFVEILTEELVYPAISEYGLRAVVRTLTSQKENPWVASLLVNISGLAPHPAQETFELDEVFTDQEIVQAATDYLTSFPDAGVWDGEWAWVALWNGWNQLPPAHHLRLLVQLVEAIPPRDDLFWMVGDGPLGRAAEIASSREAIHRLEAMNQRFARIRELAERDDPSRRDV